MKPIEITLDTGTTVEIAGGLTLADRIIASPSDSLSTGDTVKVASVDGKKIGKPVGDQASRGVVE